MPRRKGGQNLLGEKDEKRQNSQENLEKQQQTGGADRLIVI
jgi:hypothetical protein